MEEIPQTTGKSIVGTSIAGTSIADGRDRSLDPRSVIVARIAGAFWMLVLTVPLASFGLLWLLLSPVNAPMLAALGAGTLVCLALAAWSFFWPALRYRHASYRLGERGLWIRRGVVWRSEISVPKSRVQHTDVSQGPLQRRFDLATLVLHTAGTQHAAVTLGGLAHETALEIRDHLIEGGPDDAV